MADLQRLPANAPLEAVMAVLDRDGALILEGLISPQTALAMAEELRPYVEATQPGQDAFTGFKTTRTGALVARSAGCRTAILDPRIRAICDRVLLPNCTRYQLHLGQLIRIMPGQPAQPIHRDRWAWGRYLKGVEPQLNTIWALTEFTAENGATQVVPGSIDWPDDRRATPGEICQATMPAGSVLVYTGTVFHGGGANTSETDRWGLNITYALGWLRQEENQYLSCPPEIARTLEPELQQLIGYAMGSYALGYYTPPLPPGEGPEVVPPEYALTGDAAGSQLGSAELLGAINAQVRGG
ncbi:MAG: phytanoyl-CoA dioxygenase family protein [Phenylobacterium sp.]|uniref:phytanoyl-CoA dioxygenase family protein n=1 Tax=Phenylobacterium sp. TaxID=1871053 RepID=UPI0027315388|nr:phytanoyl-CoA dioxygenase family protein [Phenylobacterium sp.]MDP2009194.1 phytanoyl-CoA dioxygenase family protein [Phenylobacterium sp.]